MSRLRRQLFSDALRGVDLVILIGSLVAAIGFHRGWNHLRNTMENDPVGTLIWKFILVVTLLIVWYGIFRSAGLYHELRLARPADEATRIFKATLIGTLAVLGGVVLSYPGLIFPSAKPATPEDIWFFIGLFWALVTGTTLVVRLLLLRYVLRKLRAGGRNLRHVLVIGTNERAIQFARSVEERPELGYTIAGFVDDDWPGLEKFHQVARGYRWKRVATFDTLHEYLRTEVVDEVINVLPFSASITQSKRIDAMCEELGIKERFLSPISDVSLAKATVETFQGEPVITLHGGSRDSWQQTVKRQIDLLASLVLLIFFSPVMLLLALAIKVTSPGPVLFVQERMGLNKRIFRLYKFRTMVKDAEKMIEKLEEMNEVEGPVFKIQKDPRVTPIGRFLRKSSLDELPQLFNVFLGQMSLVGPRPLPMRDVRGFDQDRHRRRFSVRPGLTCYWQVLGRNTIPFEEWMELDLKYIDDWSLWLDLKLILQTIPVVFQPIFFGHPGEFSQRSKKLAEVLEFKNRAADDQSSSTRVAAPELQTPPS